MLAFGLATWQARVPMLWRLACSLVVLVACSRAPAAPTIPTSPPGPTPERAAWWVTIRDGAPLPPDSSADALLPELEEFLVSTDPAVRDELGFEVLVRWLGKDSPLSADAVRALRDRLVARTAEPPSPGDEVFRRSFAALVLSVIAAREVAAPAWTAAELDAQIAAAVRYAEREVDLRGHTGATGWAHAAAHTADWMKFLARHPALTSGQAARLLDGVAALVARPHGARFSHGEDERLAAAVRAVARRALLDDAHIDLWLRRVAEPLGRTWPRPFDPVLYAEQRNARDLLVSCFVALSFDDSPGAAAVLSRLRALLGA